LPHKNEHHQIKFLGGVRFFSAKNAEPMRTLFVYPSRRLGISSAPAGLDIITATPCISSRGSVHPPAA